jgi:hypothetical protein
MALLWLAQPYIWNVTENNNVTKVLRSMCCACFSSNISVCVTKFHGNLAVEGLLGETDMMDE